VKSDAAAPHSRTLCAKTFDLQTQLLACWTIRDYSDHMTTTLREAKAKLSEMVKRASRGEEVVITVHGKKTAKLVAMPTRNKKFDKEKWLKDLDKLRENNWTGRYGKSIEEILAEDRADRF
jgi:prevent-host-death family protein